MPHDHPAEPCPCSFPGLTDPRPVATPSSSQVAVVALDQPLPFWIHSQLVKLRVVATVPSGPHVLRLQSGSEIYVAPRLRHGRQAPCAARRGGDGAPAPAAPATSAVWRVLVRGPEGDALAVPGPLGGVNAPAIVAAAAAGAGDPLDAPALVSRATLVAALRQTEGIDGEDDLSVKARFQSCAVPTTRWGGVCMSGPWGEPCFLHA